MFSYTDTARQLGITQEDSRDFWEIVEAVELEAYADAEKTAQLAGNRTVTFTDTESGRTWDSLTAFDIAEQIYIRFCQSEALPLIDEMASKEHGSVVGDGYRVDW